MVSVLVSLPSALEEPVEQSHTQAHSPSSVKAAWVDAQDEHAVVSNQW